MRILAVREFAAQTVAGSTGLRVATPLMARVTTVTPHRK